MKPSLVVSLLLGGLFTACAQNLDTFRVLPAGYNGNGINNSGVVVGSVANSNGGNDAFLITPSGTITRFTYQGATNNEARSISNSGRVVGTYSSGLGSHCFLREVNGSLSSFDVPGASTTSCSGINDAGQIVGTYSIGQESHAFLKDGSIINLLDVPQATRTTASGINDTGMVVGSNDGSSFIKDPQGNYTFFQAPQIPGVDESSFPNTLHIYTSAAAINRTGQVVGAKVVTGGISGLGGTWTRYYGFIRQSDGTLTVLPSPVGDVAGINDAGILLGRIGPSYTVNGTVWQTLVSSPCSVALTSSSISLTGGSHSIAVSALAASDCGYVVRNNVPWIGVAGGSPFSQGNATRFLGIEANPNTVPRTGTITIGGHPFQITQEAAGASICSPSFGNTNNLFLGGFGDTGAARVIAGNGCPWTATSDASWLSIVSGGSGAGTGDIIFRGQANSTGSDRHANLFVGSEVVSVSQQATSPCSDPIFLPPIYMDSTGGTGTVDIPAVDGCNTWHISPPADPWLHILSATSGTGASSVRFSVDPGSDRYTIFSVQRGTGYSWRPIQQLASSGLTGTRYIPVTPCRVADTRNTGQALPSGSTRDFAIQGAPCGIPNTAKAYSLNVTAVPRQPLSYITIWATGETSPVTSLLNSPAGAVVANASLVKAGTAGAVSIFASDLTDIVLDINGYFVDANRPEALAFYPLTPCRVIDTRNSAGSFGGPSFPAGGSSRTFPVVSSQCGIPANAKAYSTNLTVVPTGPVGYVTIWPAGQVQPFVSTINSPEGRVVSNSAIVPAGDHGDVSVYALVANNATADIILDVNGYFAPPDKANPLSFYPYGPVRIADTRDASLSVANCSDPLKPPKLSGGGSTRVINCLQGDVPVVNVTVVPSGSLGYLTTWPFGDPQPFVSTLNSFDGRIVSNTAIVPSNGIGKLTLFTLTNPGTGTEVIVDQMGYFSH